MLIFVDICRFFATLISSRFTKSTTLALMVKKINILAVDEDKGIQQFISDTLTDEGFNVQTANNGLEALERLNKHTFDFVLTDLDMQHMNGMELLEEIQSKNCKTCVIIMTGSDSITSAVQAIKKGAYDYLTKPLDAASILATIKNALNQMDLENKDIHLESELKKTRHLESVSIELSRQVDNLFYLNSLTSAISAFTDMSELQNFILENCKKILGSQLASIFLMDDQDPEYLILTAVSGKHDPSVIGTRQKVGQGISGRVALEKKPLLVRDIDKEASQIQKTSPRYGSKSFMCVPLLTQNKLIGIINVTNKKDEKPFTPSDVNQLAILAGHAASAIANIRHFNLLDDLNKNLTKQIDHATQELVQKNQDLSALKQYNENIIKSLSIGLIVFNKKLSITYANNAIKTLLNLEKFLPKDFAISDLGLFDATTWNTVYHQVIHKQTTKRIGHYEYTQKNRNPLYLDFIISPFFDEKGELIGGILVVNNVTEQIIIEQKLAHSERLAIVGKLAAKVAHELNNPLDGILRFVNLTLSKIPKDTSNEEILDYLNESKAGLIRMAQIISSLLEFSRGMQPSSEKNQINETIRDAVKAMSPTAMSHNIRIITQLSDGLPKVLTGNLFQVLTNLIKNSIDSIDKNGTVTIRTSSAQDDILLEIQDTGKGIPAHILKQIFDPFFTTKPQGKGSGLGLAICMGIIEKCRGKIEVKSIENEGTTFTIILPADHAGVQTLKSGVN